MLYKTLFAVCYTYNFNTVDLSLSYVLFDFNANKKKNKIKKIKWLFVCQTILLSSFVFCCIITMQLSHYVVLGLIVDNIHDVHSLVMMHSTYVRSNVRRVSCAIWTIRATESWHLATLKFQMLVQIILSRENVATFVARIFFASLMSLDVLVTIKITRMTRHWITNTCEQKRFYQITTSNFYLI